MENEWRFAVLTVGTFLLVVAMLLACVRSCAKVSEMSVLSAMEPTQRARYLAGCGTTTTTTTTTAAAAAGQSTWTTRNDEDLQQQPSRRRYIRWISPFTGTSTSTSTTNTANAHDGGVFVVSGNHQQLSTTANFDVTTTRSIVTCTYNYENQLPTYEEATSGQLPSYQLVTECKSEQVSKKSIGQSSTPPEYCETLKQPQRY